MKEVMSVIQTGASGQSRTKAQSEFAGRYRQSCRAALDRTAEGGCPHISSRVFVLQTGGPRGRLLAWACRILGMHVVADVGALDPEDDVLGDVGGVIGNPLEITGHE